MAGHIHSMKPNRLPMPTVYKCASCAFRCTPRALSTVERLPGKHVPVRATDPQAKKVWDL